MIFTWPQVLCARRSRGAEHNDIMQGAVDPVAAAGVAHRNIYRHRYPGQLEAQERLAELA